MRGIWRIVMGATALACCFGSGAAHARAPLASTSTIRAAIKVFSGCSLETRPLMFVVPNTTVNVAVDATTTVTVKCTPNTSFTVDIDTGLHGNGINRRMYSPVANAYVSYDVYRDSPRTSVWGTGKLKNISGNSGTGAPLVITLFGRIPISGKIKAGDYADRLTVTLNY